MADLSWVETWLLIGVTAEAVAILVVAAIVDRLRERVLLLQMASLSNGVVLGPGETVQFEIRQAGTSPVMGTAVGLGPNPKDGEPPA